MRSLRISFSLFAAALLLGVAPVDAQDRPILSSLFGGRPSDSESNRPSGSGKRVIIDLSDQKLRAYQGSRLVMQTRISSGRNNATPTGNFRAGPYKSVEHYSSLYNNAPMPFSVQVTGHIFVHGYTEVPNYPASHGCIRVPVTGFFNPAKRFYEWVDIGTPIRIQR